MRTVVASLLCLAATAWAAPSHASGDLGAASWEGWARQATALGSAGELAGLLWPAATACNRGDVLRRRQCLLVRDARRPAVAGRLVRVPGDEWAVQIGAWDARTRTLPIVLRGCIACRKPVSFDGKGMFLVVAGRLAHERGGVVGPVIARFEKAFPDAGAALRWRGEAPRLRSELVVRVPTRPIRPGKGALAVELLGWRVWDPCDGELLESSVDAPAGPIEEGTCPKVRIDGAASSLAGADGGWSGAADVVTGDPEILGPDELVAGVAPARPGVEACFREHKTSGTIRVAIDIGRDGKPRGAQARGAFAGTPTGDCVVKAVEQKAQFRRFRRNAMMIVFPFVSR